MMPLDDNADMCGDIDLPFNGKTCERVAVAQAQRVMTPLSVSGIVQLVPFQA